MIEMYSRERRAACAAPLLAVLLCATSRAQPPCDGAALLSNEGLLPGMPLAVRTDVASDAQQCAFACVAEADCVAYSYAPPAAAGCALLPHCPFASGCCWLKRANASSAEARPTAGGSAACAAACSFVVRAPPGSVPPPPPPPPPKLTSRTQPLAPPPPATTRAAPGAATQRSVLYVLVDDMRPDALPWGAKFMHTPNLARLAASGTTFSRAYCNIAVCSPSRMSFLTGRYPARTGVVNFIDHIRQSQCPPVMLDASFGNASAGFTSLLVTDGGAGQCCSFCTAAPACAAWTLAPGFNGVRGSVSCTLFDVLPPGGAGSAAGAISGLRGSNEARDALVTLPQHFVNSGYFTLGTGKVFHTEEGGNGPAPWDAPGSGMPPLQDPPSWSRDANASMSNVNALAPMRECEDSCSIAANAAGDPADAKTTFRFCDRIIGDDALLKLQRAAANQKATGQPFFLAVGFRKPHLPFRHPSPYSDLYPAPANITLAAHKTMDESIPPISFHQTGLAKNPYVPLPDLQAGTLRRDYYASISWMDSQLGRVLNELDSLGLANDTLVVFHADHGWSLGESGEWEKFTIWETGTRVPLIVRAPWLDVGGRDVAELAELVDVMPTIAELAGIPVPPSYDVDGDSLVPALVRRSYTAANADTVSAASSASEAAMSSSSAPPEPPHLGQYAFSIYPRCPADTANSTDFWRNNDCLMTERSQIPFMGLSVRVDEYRYSEWRVWNGSALKPDWTRPPVGVELYSHVGDVGNSSSFDDFEVRNLHGDPAYAAIETALSALLRNASAVFGGSSRR